MADDDSPRSRTTRWETVWWGCPECGGRLFPLDSREPEDGLDPDDIRDETKAYVRTCAYKQIVVCGDCGREYDVRFESREEVDE